MPLVLLILGAAAALFFFARRADAMTPAESAPLNQPVTTLRSLYERYGAQHGVDPDLLQALAIVESSERADAVRWNPPNDVSVGLMQILASPPPGTERGQDYMAQNRFNIAPWPVTFEALKNPELNVNLGAQILAWNLRTFGFPRGVAVYNMYSMRHANLNGPFENQVYVDRVLRHLNRIKNERGM